MKRMLSIAAIFFLSLLAGCGGGPAVAPGAPPQSPPPSPAATPPAATPSAQPGEPTAAPRAAVAVAAAPPQAAAPPVAPSTPPPPANPAPPKATAPSAPAPAKAPTPAAQAPKAASPATEVAKPKAPPLDLTSLEQRLKSTNAIGVLTKLTLKNQVDDLLDKFRAYYQGRLKTTLSDLRRSYDLLVQKVLALLQDADPPLATDIVASREPIWGILSDPKKFAAI